MSLRTLIQLIISLMSFGLGNYVLYTAYLLLSGVSANLYPEAAVALSDARMMMPFDVTAGLLLIVWPFYYAASTRKT